MTAIGLVMMASNATSMNAPSFALNTSPKIEISETITSASKKILVEKDSDKSIPVEEYLRNYFSDIPVLIEIARCESQFRQYDKNGKVLLGVENNQDRGVMQINSYYHEEDSQKLGYDINTLKGNAAYGRHLFEKYGVSPWKSSSKCWGKTLAYSEYKELSLK